MRVVPGLVIMLLGVLLLLGRRIGGWSQGAARTLMTGKPQTETQRRTDTVLPTVMAIGVIILGFWVAIYALVEG
jgi:hypothetical protein